MFDWFPKAEYPLAATQLIFAMLGMGATLTLEDFIAVFRRPKGLSYGLGLQLLVIPFLAWGLAHLFGLNAAATVGLILVAAMPGGAMSNLFTWIGHGNAALSISMTAASTVLCLGTAPLILRLFARNFLPDDFDMPAGRLILEITLTLLLPLAIGMALGSNFPLHQKKITKWAIRISVAALLVVVVGSLGSGRLQLTAYGFTLPAAIVAFCVISMILSLVGGALIKVSDEENLAVGVEVTVRNVNLALLLKASLFPAETGDAALADTVLFVVLYFGGTSIFVILLPLIRGRTGLSLLPLLPSIPTPHRRLDED